MPPVPVARPLKTVSVQEEKQLVRDEANRLRALQRKGISVWCAQQELYTELRNASMEVREDKAVMMLLISVAGEFFRLCGPVLQADPEAAYAAAKTDQWALEVAHESLRSNREFMITVLQCDGRSLRHASDALRKDKDVVLAAVGSSARALEYADESLQDDEDVVIRALQRQKQEGERFNILRFASADIRAKKDLVLLALRSTTSDKVAHEGWTKAHEHLQAALCWKEFTKLAKLPLAVKGEDAAPALTVKCRPVMDPHEPGVWLCFSCDVLWISGNQFRVEIPEGPCSVVGRTRRPVPTLFELAKLLVSKIQKMKNGQGEGVERIFVIFETERRGSIAPSVWDYKRPLTDFV
mmetsp:Transcript_73180/g.160102  ORF Transcript_73180/g.160102 Transcript_73180/m.160102 type:complete len:353 (+) Transcript_73180:63-1121(+)